MSWGREKLLRNKLLLLKSSSSDAGPQYDYFLNSTKLHASSLYFALNNSTIIINKTLLSLKNIPRIIRVNTRRRQFPRAISLILLLQVECSGMRRRFIMSRRGYTWPDYGRRRASFFSVLTPATPTLPRYLATPLRRYVATCRPSAATFATAAG